MNSIRWVAVNIENQSRIPPVFLTRHGSAKTSSAVGAELVEIRVEIHLQRI